MFGGLVSHARDALFECSYQPLFPIAARMLRDGMAARHADALRAMRWVHLDAGRQDEFYLDLGAVALSDELSRLEIDHSLELFAGNPDGVDRRMPAAIRELGRALQE